METMTVRKIATSVLALYFHVFPSPMSVQSFITIEWQEKKLPMIQMSNFLFLITADFHELTANV